MLCFLRRDIFLAGGLVTGVVAAGRLAVSRSQQGAVVSLLRLGRARAMLAGTESLASS